ncbi:hypothetical protein SNE40_000049 [Patella caerulea]|uniref:Major facilitator superfamily (MFS) profile domain-containing protein n=1 Tax=Patella caerulea TaxID=87958 RepID=A0AAN8Q1R8_PATCE
MEELIDAVGSFGRFQWMLILFITISQITFGFSMLIMTFAMEIPDWWCLAPESDSISGNFTNKTSFNFKKCDVIVDNVTLPSCRREFETSITSTVVSTFDLVCENEWIKPVLTAVQMGGVLVGALLAGQAGDTIGRKKTIYLCMLLHAIFNFTIIFSVNWEMFAAFRFLIGLTIGGYLVIVVYPLEFIGMHRRALTVALPFWHIGICLLPPAAFLIPDWKYLHLVCGGFTLPFLLGWFFVPESMRWLATKDNMPEALEILTRIAKINGTMVPTNAESVLKKLSEMEKQQNEGLKKYTYLDIYRGLTMFKTTFCIQSIWFCVEVIKYGSIVGVPDLVDNLYLNFFILNSMGILLFPLAVWLLAKGRGKGVSMPLFISAIMCIIGIIIQEATDTDKSTAITALSLVAMLNVGGATIGLFLITFESYPTVVRCVGYGAANVMAQVGGVVAPYVFNVSKNRIAPFVIMSVLLILSGIAGLFLKETKDMALPDLMVTNETRNKTKQTMEEEEEGGHIGPYQVGSKAVIIDITRDQISSDNKFNEARELNTYL